jgi:hypothetical protein
MFKLYPNPSTNGFYLETVQNLQLDKVAMYDALGKMVKAPMKLSNENQLYIDTKSLKPGMYIISYQVSGKEKVEFKVAVVK